MVGNVIDRKWGCDHDDPLVLKNYSIQLLGLCTAQKVEAKKATGGLGSFSGLG